MVYMTITEFLEARIAEDEALANAVDLLSSEMEKISTHYLPEFSDFQLRWQPTAVRAECAAKRAIIREHEDFVEAIVRLSAALPGDLNQEPDAPWRTSTLRHLAAVYADHADFDERWAV